MTKRIDDPDFVPAHEWTEDEHVKFRAWWAEGLSCAAIGARLGVSKNAVVGKSHRLELPPRRNPIKYDSEPKPTKPKRLPLRSKPQSFHKLSQLVLETRWARRMAAHDQTSPDVAEAVSSAPEGAATISRAEAMAGRPYDVCCWPLGQPGTPEFRFCDAAKEVEDRPYCAFHAQQAYVRVFSMAERLRIRRAA